MGTSSRLPRVVRVAVGAFVREYMVVHLGCFPTVVAENPNLKQLKQHK